MSTSASFTLIDKHEPVITMYSHWDGNPEGFALKVMDWLSGIKITNGLALDNTNIANGIECLAAQLIAKFKTEPGNIYLYNSNMQFNLGEEYVYDIYISNDDIKIAVYECKDVHTTNIFEGNVQEFIQKFGQ